MAQSILSGKQKVWVEVSPGPRVLQQNIAMTKPVVLYSWDLVHSPVLKGSMKDLTDIVQAEKNTW